ncbi:MAG: hypothetical protein ABFD96_05800 [Armatimonadia bacterium]
MTLTYTLVAVLLSSGAAYPERTGFTLLTCAGYAAMARQQAAPLEPLIGAVRYLCIPEVRS